MINKDIKKPIIIIYEMDHIDIILSYFGFECIKCGRNFTLIPIDFGIEIKLSRMGIPFFSMTNYVSRSTLKTRSDFASNIMKRFYTDPEIDFFEHKEIKIGKIVSYSLGEYVLRVLYYLDIYNFIFDQFKDVELVYIPESTKVTSDTTGQLAKFEISLPVDTMLFYSKQRIFGIEVIPNPSLIIEKKKINNFSKKSLRMVLILGIKFLNVVVSLFLKKRSLKVFVSDYWWHIDSFIKKMGNVEISMMERKEIRNVFQYIWKYKIRFNHIDDYVTHSIKRISNAKSNFYKKRWSLLCDNSDFSRQFIWYGVGFWELVSPAYYHIVTSYSKKVVEAIEGSVALFKKQEIKVVILRASVSGQIHFSVLGLVAQKMGIHSIELQHGLEWLDTSSISAVKYCSILASYGPLIKNSLEKIDINSPKILQIGSPRFDQYKNNIIKQNIKDNLIKKFGINPELPIFLLIITDIALGQTYDTYSMSRMFMSLAVLSKKIKNSQIIIKIRSGKDQEFFFRQSIRKYFGKKIIIAQFEDIHTLISISDVIFSCFSTVVLESMIVGRPVVLLGIDQNDRMLIESHFLPYINTGAVQIARSTADLVRYAKQLIIPLNSKNTSEKANIFLSKNFCFDGKSADRMVELLSNYSKICNNTKHN